MKVDTMRKIDYYAGVPLCALLSLVRLLFGWMLPNNRHIKPQKVLFIELSEMGSAIIVDPAMRKLQRETGAELYFAIFAGNASSLRLLGTVAEENVFKIRDDGLLPLVIDTFRLLFWTRRTGIDTVIDLELFSRYTALLTGMSGAANRVGFHAFHNEGLYRGSLLTHRVAYNPHQHIAKNFVAMVNSLLAEREELPYSKTLIGEEEIRIGQVEHSEAELSAMQARIGEHYPDYRPDSHRVVLINPNASDLLPQRRWMPDYFVEVMRELLTRYDDILILITGAPNEQAEAEGLAARVGDARCVNFAGAVKFAELTSLYSVSRLMLTNDSGPGHFSSVTPLPTFVIFGPETPALYGSLGNSTPIFAGLACSPCVSASNHRKTPCHDNVCLKGITPAQVLELLCAELDSPVE